MLARPLSLTVRGGAAVLFGRHGDATSIVGSLIVEQGAIVLGGIEVR
ncbi:hypothetical protein [Geobacter sp. 60473]